MESQKIKQIKYVRKTRKRIRKLVILSMLFLLLSSVTYVVYGVGINNTYNNTEVINNNTEVINDTAGVANNKAEVANNDQCNIEHETTVEEDIENLQVDITSNNEDNTETDTQDNNTEEKQENKYVSTPYVIRCTGYCDVGYMRGGKWTYDGAIAGKYEWLGRTCNLYRINNDGTIGELIGSYTFEDTGNGINGSLKKGTSVDVWHSSEDAIWDWMNEYGDYVYIEFTS